MKVLILYNFFNYKSEHLPTIIKKFLNYYNSSKLDFTISYIQKKYLKTVDITVITERNEVLNVQSEICTESLPKFRVDIDRLIFRDIKGSVIQKTKQTLRTLYQNLLSSQIYSFKGIFLAKAFEFELSLFLNEFFGKFELIKKILQEREYDEIFLLNINKNSLIFFKKIKMNIKWFKDSFPLISNNFLSNVSTLQFFLTTLGLFLKKILFKKHRKNNKAKQNNTKNLIFFANSENQIKSILPIHNILKSDKLFNSIRYKSDISTSIKNLNTIIKCIIQNRILLKRYKNKITKNLEYQSLNLKNLLKIYYLKGHMIDLIRTYNVLLNFLQFIKKNPPKMVVIANDFMGTMKLITSYCKLKEIPTLFIPHAAIPIIEEMVTKNDVKYYILGGESDKKYYIQKGVNEQNIKVTGIPRYEYFHKNKFIELSEVRDMFDGRKYEFNKEKFTILLTTNPIDDESNEKIISVVAKSLKQLNLEQNFLIKLHPREDGYIHKKICSNLGINPIIVKDVRILDIIKSSNLLISQKSTTILESMLVGTPVICLDFINKTFRETSKYSFLDEKFLYIVYDQEILLDKIKDLSSNENLARNYTIKLKEYAKNFLFYDPEHPPVQEIIEFIKGIV
ncbi:MAG: hypothetical protein EAX91_03880 [Candidatus Lokiarchaeota archaeon]|nr:hypothetical protein [Candidatus Lokiarchaeota archaeon]